MMEYRGWMTSGDDRRAWGTGAQSGEWSPAGRRAVPPALGRRHQGWGQIQVGLPRELVETSPGSRL